ncbi:polyprenyl synthetase [Streptomyces sp. NBC_00102]|uniref:polyprenyl synthetase n=1 Tax=Streptomyces sp. NBC_00102 TaxID=2975652 RepID=UPI002259D9EF|nr:polyprenyl synthetase [Streptomyces sp. NBC_00102]MCX5396412.1 polyprenyl synthetase [Streptomyces sp. NBC_00102]
MTSQTRGDGGGGPVLLAAGLADLALTTCTAAWSAARGVLGRSDLTDLAQQGEQDLRARGRLALDRVGTGPAHLEILARHARHQGAGGPGA